MEPARRPTISLATRVEELPGIGPNRVKELIELGLTNVGRLVDHLPIRHERLEAEASIQDLAAGGIVSARGEITATRLVRGGGKKTRFEAVLHDGASRLDLVWFNAAYMKDRIHPGMRLRVQGKARRFGYGLQLANPSYETIQAEKDEPAMRGERLRPVYAASEAIDSKEIERVIARVLPDALPLLADHLDDAYRAARALPALSEAYRMQHAPETMDEVAASRRRLAYDELLLLQLGVQLRRREMRSGTSAHAIARTAAIDRAIRRRLPFTLTKDQEAVIDEITSDMARPVPMNRLLQGDVGSGKTMVAAYAMLLVIAGKRQAALMAPTELLAEQHFASLASLLHGSKVRLEMLTGGTPGSERDAARERIAKGEADIVIGTHALFGEAVRFHSLALTVIDEQHRFGVHQRALLREKRSFTDGRPHALVMTATPIPRTLALTLFGDLDISTIRSLPPGRTPVHTRVVVPSDRPSVYAELRRALDAGSQAFVVVPAIDAGVPTEDSSEDVSRGPTTPGAGRPTTTLTSLEKELGSGSLAGKRLAVVHGRLSSQQRELVMDRFRRGEIDVLLATTVIEVGVDIPNASWIIVEDAERFGLAQLHQLRGRVGRGGQGSPVCVLIADPTLTEARERLDALVRTNDGFALAERDLALRGMGEVMGLKQSGMPPFRVADLERDQELLLLARRDAAGLVLEDPRLGSSRLALLRRRLIKAHGAWLGLADVG